MLLDKSLAINTAIPADGQYTISGWIKCPVGTRALLRFITEGTADDSIEGLHWGATGGWYKYLPATGAMEYFQVSATFDESIHRIPEIRIERWFGDGEIELLLEQEKWQPKVLFWGDDKAYEALLKSSIGLIERFPLSSCLITAAEPRCEALSNRLTTGKQSSDRSAELTADIEKRALGMLLEQDFDALVLDIESLCRPIINFQGSHIEFTSDAKSLGVGLVNPEIIDAGSTNYLNILRRSLQSILRIVRPRPVVVQARAGEISASEIEDNSIVGVLRMDQEESNLNDFVFLDLPSDQAIDSVTTTSKRIDFGDLLEFSLVNLDANMMQREKSDKIVLLSNPVHIRQLEPHKFSHLPSEFVVEIDVLAPFKYRERNLLMTFELENSNGEPFEGNLSQYSIFRSTMKGVNYFKYFPAVQGSSVAEFEVSLPEHVRCTAIGIREIRDQGDVFVTRIEIQSDDSLVNALALNPERK